MILPGVFSVSLALLLAPMHSHTGLAANHAADLGSNDRTAFSMSRRTAGGVAIITAVVRCKNGAEARAACRVFIVRSFPDEGAGEPEYGFSAVASCDLPRRRRLRRRPLALRLRDLGGVGLRRVVPGRSLKDAVGADNLGLLVRVYGRVTSVSQGYIYIDDGSALTDGTSTGEKPNVGVRVICGVAGDCKPGDFLSVTGISSWFETPEGSPARCVRTREADDIIRIRAK